MGFINTLKDIFDTKSVNIGELNNAAILKSLNGQNNFYEESIDDIEVINEYKLVKHLIENNFPIIFVSGKAGTGKTTLIRYLRNSLNKFSFLP